MKENTFKKSFIDSGSIISIGKERLLIGWGKREWSSSCSPDYSTPSFYFPDFFLENPHPWFQHQHWQEIEIRELICLISHDEQEVTEEYQWNNEDQIHFHEAVAVLQNLFRTKQLAKAVPFVFERSDKTLSSSQLTRSLISVLNYALKNPAYVYGFWDQRGGILGATPELLFRFVGENDGIRMETMACAATSDRQSLRTVSFLKDPKEVHEHTVVVQGMNESLAPFGKVTIGDLELLELPKLVHLMTRISVSLKSAPDFNALVRALHPTPALGAFPREEGMEWLKKIQCKIDRKRYGAPVGFVYKTVQDSRCYVAIRNAQWDEKSIGIGAGCGVVAESLPEREWAEVRLKIQAIKEILSL